MYLAQLGYGIPGARLPFLPEGIQKISKSLSVGRDRPEFVLAWSAGDFEFRSNLRLEEGEVLDFYYRVARVRKGIMDFNRIRFEAGAELKDLGQDTVGQRVQVPATVEMPLRLRGWGTRNSLQLGTEETTGVLELAGRSRFAHGWFHLTGKGRLAQIEIENLGPPQNGMQELFWFFVPILTALLTLLFVARTWSARFLMLLFLLAFSVVMLELTYRKSPIRSRAYDLQRVMQDADTLTAFGFLHPERNLDVRTGRFSDLYSVVLPPRKDVYRVALIGFEAAGQEDRSPSQRWYAPLATVLTERMGRPVQVIHALHSGALPSACSQQLGPLFKKLGVDLLVWAVAPTDMEGFDAPAWEPATEGWSSFLLMNAFGFAKGKQELRFTGEAQAFARERTRLESQFKSLGTLETPGRAPWEVTGAEARQRVEALCEDIIHELR